MSSFNAMVVRAFLFSITLASLWGCRGDEKKVEDQIDNITKVSEDVPDGLTPEQAAKVVAKVGERTITVGDVTRQINRLSPYIRRRWAAPEKRKEFLDKLIRVELLSQEAERLGLDQDPEVQRSVKQMMIRMMISNDLEKNLLPTSIKETLLKAAYEKDRDKYHRPAQVRGSHIVLASKAEADKLVASLQKETKDRNRVFRAAARENSLDKTTSERGGDLGYFSKSEERRPDEPELPANLAAAVWKVENVGDLAAAPVQTDQGFHVVMLTNKKPEMNRSFESVKRSIEDKMLREKRREALDGFIAELKSKAKIEIVEENLAKLEQLQASAPAPMGPGAAVPPAPQPKKNIDPPVPAPGSGS